MRSWRARHRYRVDVVDSQLRRSAGPTEACGLGVVVDVQFPNLLPFLLLMGGLLLFLVLVALIVVLVSKTLKIDLEIRRLQKVAELRQLHNIDTHWTPEEASVSSSDGSRSSSSSSGRVGASGAERSRVKAIDSFDGAGPDELAFERGDVIVVTRRYDSGMWRGELNGVSGLFPAARTRELPPALPTEAPERDALLDGAATAAAADDGYDRVLEF